MSETGTRRSKIGRTACGWRPNLVRREKTDHTTSCPDQFPGPQSSVGNKERRNKAGSINENFIKDIESMIIRFGEEGRWVSNNALVTTTSALSGRKGHLFCQCRKRGLEAQNREGRVGDTWIWLGARKQITQPHTRTNLGPLKTALVTRGGGI